MMNLTKLEDIVADQLKNFQKRDIGIIRNIDFNKYLKTKQITVISGIRRSGKSTLLAQFSKRFKNFYYINFDDERLLDFSVNNFNDLMVIFRKIYPSKVIFLDEIQDIEKWEKFIRRIYDEGYKIFLTGSNAKLLSSELGTHLTGRYFKIELYPFSFKEFLHYKKVDYKEKGAEIRAKILKIFDNYLKNGGFPEFVKYKDKEFVKRIYEDVLYRDLLTRFNIREVKSFKQLANFLFTNLAGEISYNSLKKILGFKSVMTVRNYIEFMEESFLVFELYKYDYSLKKQYVSDKKIYVIDNGMRNTVAFYFSKDLGKMLENLVFIELKMRGQEIYYYKNKKECDFIIKEKNKITQVIQVSVYMDENNREREVGGLLEAMNEFKLKKGLILTKDQEGKVKEDGKIIEIKSVYKWALE
ncbi:ATP-binding protein [bacterium]|nr:ATP-binding protein [bacterium]